MAIVFAPVSSNLRECKRCERVEDEQWMLCDVTTHFSSWGLLYVHMYLRVEIKRYVACNITLTHCIIGIADELIWSHATFFVGSK